jgi:hypothetical protein
VCDCPAHVLVTHHDDGHVRHGAYAQCASPANPPAAQ